MKKTSVLNACFTPYPGQVMLGRCASRQASPNNYEKIITFFCCLLAGGESNSPGCF